VAVEPEEAMRGSRLRHVGLALALAVSLSACERAERASDSPPSPEVRAAERPKPATGRELPGRFRPARRGAASAPQSEEQRRRIEQLEAIGYLSGSQPARGAGITIHDPARAHAGLNFFTSGHTQGALLMDMDGEVLHEWRYRFADAFEGDPSPASGKRRDWWRRAYLFPNGDVLAIITDSGLLKIDKSSQLLWAKAINAHHDLAIAPNGDLTLLTRRVRVVPRVNAEQPIVEDLVAVLDSEGNERRRFSESGRRSGDIFHTNSIELLDGSVADANPAFAAGNLLISLLHLNAIAVVDPEQEKVVWVHTGGYRQQHDPKILANGNLLLFDNGGRRGASAILEFDLGTMALAWEYRGSKERPFFSKTCGTSERLPNGNTLVSETDFGRAFEVNPEGEIVWEFYNPHRAGENDRFIASLPELIRLPPDLPNDWLD
jgi:hypothetical protein